MIIKQKLAITVSSLFLSASILIGVPTFANAASCGGVNTAIIGGSICNGVNNASPSAQNNAIWKILIFVLKIMTAGVGIAAVGGIVYAGILYASAGDSADQTKKSKDIIKNTIIGLIAYGMMYVFLNFLIPGGIFT